MNNGYFQRLINRSGVMTPKALVEEAQTLSRLADASAAMEAIHRAAVSTAIRQAKWREDNAALAQLPKSRAPLKTGVFDYLNDLTFKDSQVNHTNFRLQITLRSYSVKTFKRLGYALSQLSRGYLLRYRTQGIRACWHLMPGSAKTEGGVYTAHLDHSDYLFTLIELRYAWRILTFLHSLKATELSQLPVQGCELYPIKSTLKVDWYCEHPI